MERNRTVAVYTLGCKVNQYESEAFIEALERKDIKIVLDNASVAIINTCTVTAESDRKCRQTIRRAIRENPGAFVIVTGCMSQMDPKGAAGIAGVDYVCGNKNKMQVVNAALAYLESGERPAVCCNSVESLENAPFERMTVFRSERTRAYIKVEDGCESRCSYCIIAAARGKIRSKPIEDVLKEAAGLAAAGYKEIVLTGIEVSAYGKDLPHTDLADLVVALDQLDGIERIRFPSTDPACLRPDFTDRIASCRHLAPHIHLSLQSGCDRTLFAMKRRYNTATVERYVSYLRDKIPEIQFTADLIVGFPGETEEDFAETCRVVDRLGLLGAHVFAYSRRPGTVADSMPEQVPEEVKHRRSEELITLCAEKKDSILRRYAAEHATGEVLFETFENGIATGRLGNYMEVSVPSPCDLRGKILPVTIFAPTASDKIDILEGKL